MKNTNKRSYVLGIPKYHFESLPKVKKTLSNQSIAKRQYSKLSTVDQSPQKSDVLNFNIPFLPAINKKVSYDFLPYIYAQNGIEYTKKRLLHEGNPIHFHFGLEKKQSSVNLIQPDQHAAFKKSHRAFTLDYIEEF